MKTALSLSPWQKHVERWKSCTRCVLHEGRKSVVLAKGDLPCDALFVGEAPGKSEDVLGTPFEGPAGQLLHDIIDSALEGLGRPTLVGDVVPWRVAFTNIVACIPLDEDGGKAGEPEAMDIKACRPRLVELVQMAKPKLIFLVGKLAKRHISGQSMFDPVTWLAANQFMRFQELDHPAYIIRMNAAQRNLAMKRCEVRVRCAFQELAGA